MIISTQITMIQATVCVVGIQKRERTLGSYSSVFLGEMGDRR